MQGREGVLGWREGTPISANLPRFCPAPVSASSTATLATYYRGTWGGEPGCSQSASSERSVSHTRSAPAGGSTDPHFSPAQQAAPRHKNLEGRLRRRRTSPRRPKSRSRAQVSPIPRKSGGVGRLLRRALGWPTGLQALRHAAATPTRQEFEFSKTKVNLAHRTTPYPDPV